MGFFSSIIKGITGLLGDIVGFLIGVDFDDFDDQAQGALVNKQSNIDPIPVVYGKRKVGGVRVFVSTGGGKKNEYLYMAIVLSEGNIEAIDQIYVNDKLHTHSDYSGLISVDKKLGGDNQGYSSLLSGADDSWGTNHRLRGVAYLAIRIKYDQDVFGGIPEIQCVIRGRRVYDPRTSTTGYSTNPALCLRDYLTNSRYGKGLPTSAIDDTKFIAAANEYDGTETPYTGGAAITWIECNARLDAGKTVFDNVKEMLQGMRGLLPYTDGEYGLSVDKSETSSFDLTPDNILSDITVTDAGKGKRFNRVIAKFPNPAANWQMDSVTYPEKSTDSNSDFVTFLAEDNGEELIREINLNTITNLYQAREMARIVCEASRRNTRSVTLTATSEAMDIAVGDVVRLEQPSLGWTGAARQLMRVVSTRIKDNGEVDLSLIEYNDIYSWVTGSEENDNQDTTLPDPFGIEAPTVPATTEQSSLGPDGTVQPSVSFSWTEADDAFVSDYEVQWKLTSASDYTNFARTSESSVELFGLDVGSEYTFRVRSLNTLGVRSDFITTTRTLQGDTTPPGAITLGAITGGVRSIIVEWTNPTDLDYAFTEVHVTSTNTTPATNALPTAKVAGEEYVYQQPSGTDGVVTKYFFLRPVDFSGNKGSYTGTSGNSGSSVQADSGDIADGAVDTTEIADNAVTITKIADTLQSTDYSQGVAGWKLTTDGTFEAADALFRGNVTAETITVNDSLVVLGPLEAKSLAPGSITREMLSQDALDSIFGSLATSVGGSNGDFKEDTGSFTTSGGTVTLGTSSDKFDHGTADVDVEFIVDHFFYATTNYTTAQAQATLNFEVSADGTFTDLTSATKTHTLQFGEYDLSSYYGYTYLVYFLTGDVTKTFTSGSGNDIPDDTDLQFRVRVTSVGTAFTGQTVPFTLEANEGVTGVTSTGGNADTLDNLDSTAFLRSNTNDTFDGDLTITGQLILQGSIDQYNVTDLDVTDKTITVNSGNTQSLSDGAGLIVDRGTAADASITWDETNDHFVFNHYLRSSDTVEGGGGSKQLLAQGTEADIWLTSTGGGAGTWRILGSTGSSTKMFRIYDHDNNSDRLTINASGNATFSGSVTWSGGSSTNANTAYTYSQVGHLPLAGGTLTGRVTFPTGSTTKPILAEGFFARTTADTTGTHDIWGISETYNPSASSAADQWGIQWSGNPNEINFIGAGQKKLSIDLDTAGDVEIDGNRIWDAGDFTSTNITNWNTAYGWGDHSTEGYLTAEADTLATVTGRGATTTNAISTGAITTSGTLKFSGNNHYFQAGTNSVDLKNASNVVLGGFNASGVNTPFGYQVSGTTVIASTRRFYASNGTTVKAAYSFDGDSGTGISRTAAGRIDFLSSGAVKAYIKTGTSNPISPTMYVDGRTEINGVVTWTGGSSTNANTAYGWGDHSTQNYAVTTGDTFTGLFKATGGSLIEIQNQQDGGTGRGIMMWDSGDTNWGIYMGQAGGSRSLAGSSAASGLDGRTSYAVRFRVHDSTGNIGFLFENSSEEALFQVRGDTGEIYSRNNFYPSNQTTNYVSSTRIANWQTAYGWGDHSAAGYLETNDNITVGTISSGAITSSGTSTFDGIIVDGDDDASATSWGTAPTAIIGGFSSGNHDGSNQLTDFRMAVISKDTNGGNTPVMQRNQAWVTGGISGEAYNSAARWDLGRWENSGTDARSRLDLYLADDGQTWDHVMTWRAEGSNQTRVGINTTTPTATLDVNGAINSSGQFITAGSITAGNGSTTLGYYVGTTQVIQGSTRNLVNIGTIGSTGEIGVTNGSLTLSSGYNVQWGGAYSSGFPSIFANSTLKVLRFAPSGNTDGVVLEINTGGLDVQIGGYEVGGTTVIASTRRFYASDGTVSKAAYSFDGESSTGMYKYGTNQIGFTAGGSLMAYVQNVSGSAALVVQGQINASGGNSGNWNTAYGWGDHSTVGYLETNDNITVGTIDSTYLETTSGGVVSISTDGSSYASGMLRGALEIGSTSRSYRYTSGWSGSMQSGILANTSEDWEFMVHDAGDALGSIFVYESANNAAGLIRFGRNAGYGVSNAVFEGTISSGAITSSGTSSFGNFRLTDSSKMGFGTVKSGGSVNHTASVDEGIFWHITNTYGIYRTSGAWSSPDYQQLRLEWETGIELDGGSAYGKSGVTVTESDLLISNNATDPTLKFVTTSSSADPVLQMNGQAGIAGEGFEIWYDNSVGDVHLHTTYNDSAAAIRFHTSTAGSKATSNERFTITGDGHVLLAGDNGFSPYMSRTNTNSLNAGYNWDTDSADLWINYRGYQNGTSRFRDFRVGNGKNVGLIFVDGSTREVDFQNSTDILVGGTTIIDSARNAQFSHLNVASGTTEAEVDVLLRNRFYSPSGATGRILNWYSATGGTELYHDKHGLVFCDTDTTTGQPARVGLALANSSTANNVWSPAITFGGLSTSGGYQSAGAAIAAKLPSAADTNFRAGDLHFFTSGTANADRGLVSKLVLTRDGDLEIEDGDFIINGTTRINSAGNATLGSITSGAITATNISATSLSLSGAFTPTSISATSTISGSQFRASYGSESAPAFTFKNDDDTGMYGSANRIHFAVSGDEKIQVQPSSIILFESTTIQDELKVGTIPQTVIDSSRQLQNVTVSQGEAEYGQSLNGNFGQWLAHSRYNTAGFDADVDYWGWNFIQGQVDAPAAISTQWYRNRVALGDAYGHGVSSGDYWLEMAYPRYGNGAGAGTSSQLSRGTMWVRTCESGTLGSWSEIGGNLYNGLEIRGVAAIDISRNATLGTISSGVITATGEGHTFYNSSNSIKFGRNANENIQLIVTDGANKIIATQDSDANADHDFILDRVFNASTGESNFFIKNAGTTQLQINKTGYVGIGTPSNSSYKLYVGGSIAQSSGSIYSYGDVVIGQGSLKRGSTTIIDANRNVFANNNVLGNGIRSSGRGELHLNSTGENTVSEIFFGYGSGYAGNDNNIRWGISDRGTSTGKLSFYKGPKLTGSGFYEMAYFNKLDNKLYLAGGLAVGSLGVIDSSRNASFSNLVNTGGAKLEIQDSVDGGSTRGIYMWNSSDTNWGIYMSTAGSGKSLSGGNAPAGLDGRTSHGIRFRVANSSAQIGFLWENGSNLALAQITADSGNFLAKGNITAYASDERLKTNIKPIERPLEKLMKLRGVEFDWIDGIEKTHGFIPKCKHETGVIAQEVEQVIPDAISPAPFNNEYKTVEHTKIISLLIESVRSQQETIESLTKRIEELENGDN